MQADEEQHWSSVKVDNRKRQQVPRVPTDSLLLKVGNYPGTHWQARHIFPMFFCRCHFWRMRMAVWFLSWNHQSISERNPGASLGTGPYTKLDHL